MPWKVKEMLQLIQIAALRLMGISSLLGAGYLWLGHWVLA
jgi:hypothetical protein